MSDAIPSMATNTRRRTVAEKVRRFLELDARGGSNAGIAAEIGERAEDVSAARQWLGLGKRPARNGLYSTPVVADVRAMNAAGLCDRVIGERLGLQRRQVRGIRRHLGLPTNRDGEAPYIGQAKGRVIQDEMNRSLSTRYGLMPGLSRQQLRLLFALASGPLSRAQLMARGVNPNSNRRPGSTITRDLLVRGLIAVVPNPEGRTDSAGLRRPYKLYLLTGMAMDMMASAGGQA